MPSWFEVDPAACIRCGACVRDCAFRALKSASDGAPVLAEPDKCMRCQHCLAVCPTGAVRLDGHAAGQCVQAAGAELPTPEAVRNWLALRRSVRQYGDSDIDTELLASMLEALGNTPTGCNAGALTFTCFPNRQAMASLREEFRKLAEASEKPLPRWLAVAVAKMRSGGSDLVFRGASGLLVVSSDTGNPAVTSPREDVTIACSNFELLANAHGLATCWCGFLGLAEEVLPGLVEKLAGVPSGHPFAAMLFGHPVVRYPRGVVRDNVARIVYRSEAGQR